MLLYVSTIEEAAVAVEAIQKTLAVTGLSSVGEKLEGVPVIDGPASATFGGGEWEVREA